MGFLRSRTHKKRSGQKRDFRYWPERGCWSRTTRSFHRSNSLASRASAVRALDAKIFPRMRETVHEVDGAGLPWANRSQKWINEIFRSRSYQLSTPQLLS